MSILNNFCSDSNLKLVKWKPGEDSHQIVINRTEAIHIVAPLMHNIASVKPLGAVIFRATLNLHGSFGVISRDLPRISGSGEAFVIVMWFFGSLSVTDLLSASPWARSDVSPLLFFHRYDLDCKSDNLSKHVSDSFTSATISRAFMRIVQS